MIRTLTDISLDLKRLASGRSGGEYALRDLAAKLDSSPHSALAGVDLAGTYSPEIMLPDGERSVRLLASGMELFRDVLIFVPVLYTWWRISQALTAYSDYKGDEPFLLAWQQGFGSQTERLSTSALIVSGVVLTVIFLTVVAHQVRDYYEHGVQERQQRLAVLLGEATLLLRASPADGVPVVAKSGTETRQAKGPDKRRQDSQEMADQFRTTQRALTEMATRIGEETQRLLTAFEQERTLSRQEAHAHRTLAAEVSASTELLGASLRDLNQNANVFNDLVLRMVFVVDRLDPDGAQA